MAHECPDCGMTCHCCGDIDDLNFGETEPCCTHRLENEEDDYYQEYLDYYLD